VVLKIEYTGILEGCGTRIKKKSNLNTNLVSSITKETPQ